MNREDVLAQCLVDMETETDSVQELVGRYPQFRAELEPLLRLSLHLDTLPRDFCLPDAAKARIRAQLMREVRRPAPTRTHSGGLWGLLFPEHLGRLVARPAGLALALLLSAGLLTGSTVSAAMESLPGDGLYPVKTVAERARLALAFSDSTRAETYLWIASSRVGELSRIAAADRVELAPKLVEEYEHSVAQALRLAASEKAEEPKLTQQVASVRTSLHQVYEKAPQDLQVILARSLSLGSGGATATQPTAPATLIAPSAPAGPGPAETQASVPPAATAAPPPGPLLNTGPASSLPDTGKTPGDKTPAAPSEPAKGGPVDQPLVEPSPVDKLPTKGNIGPATGPVPGKDSGIPPASTDAPKTEPTMGAPASSSKPAATPATPATEPAKTDPVGSGSAPPPGGTQKGSTVQQSGTATPAPSGTGAKSSATPQSKTSPTAGPARATPEARGSFTPQTASTPPSTSK